MHYKRFVTFFLLFHEFLSFFTFFLIAMRIAIEGKKLAVQCIDSVHIKVSEKTLFSIHSWMVITAKMIHCVEWIWSIIVKCVFFSIDIAFQGHYSIIILSLSHLKPLFCSNPYQKCSINCNIALTFFPTFHIFTLLVKSSSYSNQH